MIERSIAFGPGNSLIGTLCIPQSTAKAGVGQILLNAGVLHRIGPHRINVRLARRLARRGIPSIRFDLAGLGDSASASGEASFEDQAVMDIRSAMDALGAQAGVSRFALFGFCSGGNHGYAAAHADERIAGLLMYDTYFYRTPKSRVNRVLTSIRRLGLFRFLRGVIGRLLASVAAKLRVWRGAEMAPQTPFPYPSRAELAQRVKMLHARGVKVGIAYSGGDLHYNYRDQFADAFGSFGIVDLVTYDYLPQMGHTAMRLAWQEEFIRRVEDWTAALDADCRRDSGASSGPV